MLLSINNHNGGSALLRSLGLYEYSKLSKKSIAALALSNTEIGNFNVKAASVEIIELPEIVKEVENSVTTMLNDIDALIDGSEFTLR